MADDALRLDLSLVDEATPALKRLLAELGADTRRQVVVDPVVVAAEAAVAALFGVAGPGPVGEVTLQLMPVNATPFERGLAVGMALILALPAHPWGV